MPSSGPRAALDPGPPPDPQRLLAASARLKVLDATALGDDRVVALCRSLLLRPPLYVPGFIALRLGEERFARGLESRTRASFAMVVLFTLLGEHSLLIGNSGAEVPNDSGTDEETRVLRLVDSLGAVLISASDDLVQRARNLDLPVITVAELAPHAAAPPSPGEVVSVVPVYAGLLPGQAVALLGGGVRVVVEDGARFMGQRMLVQLVQSVTSEWGTLLRAVLARDDDNEGPGSAGCPAWLPTDPPPLHRGDTWPIPGAPVTPRPSR